MLHSRWSFQAGCWFTAVGMLWILGNLAFCQQKPDGTIERPNILWITSEDNGPELGCYGDTFATSPNIDAFAKRSIRFNHCWSNAPVCAPARTTLITGMYATSLGASNMRSRAVRPDASLLLPELLRRGGYYCSNNSKEDYNLVAKGKPWNDSSKNGHWRNRPDKTPFFAVFNFTQTHESQIRTRPHTGSHSPDQVPIPPYHPDLPEVRKDWAQYYDRIEEMDVQVGRVLRELEEDGLVESTIVFYFGDHGSGMPRSKRSLYESGLRVPLLLHIPESLRKRWNIAELPGASTDRLVSFVDFAPTVLSLAGLEVPNDLEGQIFAGQNSSPPREFVFGFRDRMDERIDMSRSVRDSRYLLIKNFLPFRPQGTFHDYMFQTPTTRAWQQAFLRGELNEKQSFFWKIKPEVELYDIPNDPYQLRNLAGLPEYRKIQTQLHEELRSHMIRTRDHGVIPEGLIKRKAVESHWNWTEMVDAAFAGSTLSMSPPEFRSDNLVVRFWAAQHCLYSAIASERPGETAAIDRVALSKCIDALQSDSIADVRIPAYEAELRLGSDGDSAKAVAGLAELLNLDKFGLLTSLAAMNALANIDPSKLPMAAIRSMKTQDKSVEPVYQDYIARLREYLTTTSNH